MWIAAISTKSFYACKRRDASAQIDSPQRGLYSRRGIFYCFTPPLGDADAAYALESLTSDQLLGIIKYSNVQERLSYIKKSAIEKSERLEKIHQAQVRHCLEALAWWLGGVFFLFGGGWTIRWIYRGFRKADT